MNAMPEGYLIIFTDDAMSDFDKESIDDKLSFSNCHTALLTRNTRIVSRCLVTLKLFSLTHLNEFFVQIGNKIIII